MNRLKEFKATVCLAIAGSVLLGGFMSVWTLFLGHVRPMWMEFDYAPAYALVGLAGGAAAGLVVDWRRYFLRVKAPQFTA